MEFNPRSGELIIPSKDEETALSIINLIISNFKGDLKLEEIINKDLLAISILKCKKFKIVKNKLIEQIIQNMTETQEPLNNLNNLNDLNIKKENNTSNLNINNNNYYYYNDNNDNNQQNIDLDVYDGNEFSFL